MLRLALLGAAVDLPGPARLLSVLLPGGYDLLVRPVLEAAFAVLLFGCYRVSMSSDNSLVHHAS